MPGFLARFVGRWPVGAMLFVVAGGCPVCDATPIRALYDDVSGSGNGAENTMLRSAAAILIPPARSSCRCFCDRCGPAPAVGRGASPLVRWSYGRECAHVRRGLTVRDWKRALGNPWKSMEIHMEIHGKTHPSSYDVIEKLSECFQFSEILKFSADLDLKRRQPAICFNYQFVDFRIEIPKFPKIS